MICGNIKIKTEKEYRNTLLDSSSSLKTFSLDRRKYYKIYIEGEKEKDQDETKASTMGRIVEVLLLEPDTFDDKFFMSACLGAPTGLMGSFIEALYAATADNTLEDGSVTKSFEELSRLAYAQSEFKITYEAVIKRFLGSDAEIYYDEIRRVRSLGLTVVTAKEVTNAEKIVEDLKTNQFTRDIVNRTDSTRYTILNQCKIENFNVDGHLCKAMIDRVEIDHKNKTIQPDDLKCVWSVENFYSEYYLYRLAFIQAYIYYKACESLTLHEGEKYYGYQVLPTRFIVCDSIGYYNPLVYTLSIEDIKDAYEGFEYKGRSYTGVKEIIEDLNWAYTNNIWGISRKNCLKNGLLNIKE